MRQPHVNDQVRLTGDIPQLLLHRGQVGIVRSTWFAPAVRYEVEFQHNSEEHYNTLAMLVEDQLCLAEIDEAVTH